MGQVTKGGQRLAKTDHPGPGSYEARPQTSAPAYQMLGRNIKHKIEPVPGPGQYNVAPARKSLGSGKITSQQTRATTGTVQKAGSPGPGSYELQSARQRTGGKFGLERRVNPITQPNSSSPGPGAYQGPQGKVASATPSFS